MGGASIERGIASRPGHRDVTHIVHSQEIAILIDNRCFRALYGVGTQRIVFQAVIFIKCPAI
jgi:hypothetical protein